VVDSLLFVFGYRASKMRQAKVSDLIHSSHGHEELDSCSVEVHFREILDQASTVMGKDPAPRNIWIQIISRCLSLAFQLTFLNLAAKFR